MAWFGKSKFTPVQRKAYYSGMGYRIAHEKKGILFDDLKNRESFQKGYTAAGKKISGKPEKYPKLKRQTKKKG